MAAHKMSLLAEDVNIKELLSMSLCMPSGFIMNKVDLIETNMSELISLMFNQVCTHFGQHHSSRI